ncbi:MAG: dTDP-4-dehydrorhamnose 3,5-epimerase [Brevundimonas sp.]|uniref:dTDP-4-dehydrorhamnose 3,5-epimerase n=1 Tax=Brevundimonas sp. TaxID=1871086 RepID=UPI0025BA325F|nr:dTDP-4-dehydrorhamnose 3,5-epimerase [Brevundimonas sp.]MBX3478339.1 dTDP-4-dehydrorhamnose 3,5-epimerase [Brevundimonas sp.]
MGLGLTLIRARRHADDRGWFQETYSPARLRALGLDHDFIQDNESLSRRAGTVRGLHFQRPPQAQAKLVRCLAGAIFDVAVDLRRGSPTFGRAVSATLEGASGDQLYVPVGFAHGFMTLTPDAVVAYKVSAPYAPDSEGGLAWDDPALALDWPEAGESVLSDRDRQWPRLSGIAPPFDYDGRPMALEIVS